jgi:phosphate transport system substrate-binding protein
MLSRDLKDEEIKAASAKHRPPRQIVVAYDCIVPVVHPSNPVKNLSVAQLLGIYSGRITDWKDVGGKPGRIVVVSRDSSSGTYDCWEQKIMHSGGQKSRVFAGASIQASNGAVAQVVSKNGLAIGYVGLGYLNRELKAVSVNGVFGSARTAMDKTFPIARSLILATPGEPRGEPKAMIDFMLSAKGQKLVVEAGFVPLR